MNYCGLTKEEYIGLLKECGMCTKKWTRSKVIQFKKKAQEIIANRKKNKKKDKKA